MDGIGTPYLVFSCRRLGAWLVPPKILIRNNDFNIFEL